MLYKQLLVIPRDSTKGCRDVVENREKKTVDRNRPMDGPGISMSS